MMITCCLQTEITEWKRTTRVLQLISATALDEINWNKRHEISQDLIKNS